jgi:hypothetical protein
MVQKQLLNMSQSLFVQEDFFSSGSIVENRDWDSPRALPADAPITAATDEGLDAVLADIRDPLYLVMRNSANS